MDKYDSVLDVLEHPDKYTPSEIEEILSDSEAKEFYTLLCKTGASMKINEGIPCPEVDEEWKKMTNRHRANRFRFLFFGNRVATIAIISLTALAAVALGVAVAVKQMDRRVPDAAQNSAPAVDEKALGAVIEQNDTAICDSLLPKEPVLYKDVTLKEILDVVEGCYGVSVDYLNAETAKLHLYYRFNPELPLDEVIDQLNTFEQINIRIEGTNLIVE